MVYVQFRLHYVWVWALGAFIRCVDNDLTQEAERGRERMRKGMKKQRRLPRQPLPPPDGAIRKVVRLGTLRNGKNDDGILCLSRSG